MVNFYNMALFYGTSCIISGLSFFIFAKAYEYATNVSLKEKPPVIYVRDAANKILYSLQ